MLFLLVELRDGAHLRSALANGTTHRSPKYGSSADSTRPAELRNKYTTIFDLIYNIIKIAAALTKYLCAQQEGHARVAPK